MICDRIKQLREQAGYSQAQLAKLFHVSADYLLGLTASSSIVLDGYTQEEIDDAKEVLDTSSSNLFLHAN